MQIFYNIIYIALKCTLIALDNKGEGRVQSPRSPKEVPSLDPRVWEEHTLVFALRGVVRQGMENTEDISVFDNTLRDVFPSTARKTIEHGYDTQLKEAVQDQLREDNMKDTPEIVEKVRVHKGVHHKYGQFKSKFMRVFFSKF